MENAVQSGRKAGGNNTQVQLSKSGLKNLIHVSVEFERYELLFVYSLVLLLENFVEDAKQKYSVVWGIFPPEKSWTL